MSRNIDRRHRLASAVLGREILETRPESAFETVSGVIHDVTPHLIIMEEPNGDEARLVIAPWATAWHGSEVAPTDLPKGHRALIRAPGGRIADRIWVGITRITGTVTALTQDGKDLLVQVDCGPHRLPRVAVIPSRVSGRIRVRFPRLEPGYLIDLIGVVENGSSVACTPATSQPAYHSQAAPPPPQSFGRLPASIRGSATWSCDGFDWGWDPGRVEQASCWSTSSAAYPMLEVEDSGCTADPQAALPYLARGTRLRIRNTCADSDLAVPITACGCVSAKFRDRCLDCATSPRGRVAELTPRAFVELGGSLEAGCFNADLELR